MKAASHDSKVEMINCESCEYQPVPDVHERGDFSWMHYMFERFEV